MLVLQVIGWQRLDNGAARAASASSPSVAVISLVGSVQSLPSPICHLSPRSTHPSIPTSPQISPTIPHGARPAADWPRATRGCRPGWLTRSCLPGFILWMRWDVSTFEESRSIPTIVIPWIESQQANEQRVKRANGRLGRRALFPLRTLIGLRY